MKAEEQQYIVDHTNSLIAGIVIIDYETHEIIDINDTAIGMIGKPKEQIIGNICHKCICPAEKGSCPVSDLKQTINRSESQLLADDGEVIPILKTATQMNRDGRLCIVESFIDISKIKKADERLVQKLKFEEIVSSISTSFVFSDDIDMNINHALEKLSETCGGNRGYIFLFNDDGTMMCNTHEYCEKGVTHKKEKLQELPLDMYLWWMNKLRNGETIHIRDVSSLPAEASAEKEILGMQGIRSIVAFPLYTNKRLAGFLGLDNVRDSGNPDEQNEDNNILRMATDIIGAGLERRRAEKALKASEDKYQTLVEKGNDGIIIIQDGVLKYGNKRMEDITGYRIEDVLERPFVDFISPKYRNLVQERYMKRLKGQNVPSTYEITIVSINGIDIPVDVSPSAIEYEGRPADMAIIRDVTERRKSEDAIINAKLAAEASDRAKTEFIAKMSHELRTPLNSILGFSNVLCSETHGPLNEDQKKYISNILRSGEHLLDTINDILAISTIESTKMRLHINDLIVSDAFYEVEAFMAPIAAEKSIELKSDIDTGTLTIKADMIKFKQILYNLVNNAIKFTDQGGNVTIRGKIMEKMLHVSVIDNGIGISLKDQSKLFYPFYQVDSSLTRKHGGTGLGLVVAKKFVEMHGGEILVESEIGNGSTFTFKIPTNPVIEDTTSNCN